MLRQLLNGWSLLTSLRSPQSQCAYPKICFAKSLWNLPRTSQKNFSHLNWKLWKLKTLLLLLLPCYKKKKMVHPTQKNFLQKVFGIFPGPLKKNFSHLSWKLWKLKTLLSLLSPCYRKKKKMVHPTQKIFLQKVFGIFPGPLKKNFSHLSWKLWKLETLLSLLSPCYPCCYLLSFKIFRKLL